MEAARATASTSAPASVRSGSTACAPASARVPAPTLPVATPTARAPVSSAPWTRGLHREASVAGGGDRVAHQVGAVDVVVAVCAQVRVGQAPEAAQAQLEQGGPAHVAGDDPLVQGADPGEGGDGGVRAGQRSTAGLEQVAGVGLAPVGDGVHEGGDHLVVGPADAVRHEQVGEDRAVGASGEGHVHLGLAPEEPGQGGADHAVAEAGGVEQREVEVPEDQHGVGRGGGHPREVTCARRNGVGAGREE